MRADEIREMGADDIAARIRDLEEERFRLKFRSATEPLEEPLLPLIPDPQPGAQESRPVA